MDRGLIRIERPTGSDLWGNVFLTGGWVLYVDMTEQQHDVAMQRLGIDATTILISGSIRPVYGGGVWFRSSSGVDRGEISEAVAIELMAVIRQIVLELCVGS